MGGRLDSGSDATDAVSGVPALERRDEPGLSSRRRPTLETAFLAVVWVVAAALFWHGLSLDLWRDDTIGPGAYPLAALAGLLVITTALLVKALSVHELRLYSPFAAGLQDDSRLRQLVSAMAVRAGIPIRVVTQDGEGRFSALWKGFVAGKAGDALTVVTSDLTSLPNFRAAAFCDGRLEPIGGLFFDPDVMIVAPDSPWRDCSGLAAADRRLRLGFGHHGDVDHGLDRWLAIARGLRFEPVYSEDGASLIEALCAGRLDAVALRMSKARQALAIGRARCVAIFGGSSRHANAAGVADPPPGGLAVASGHWAALAVPRGMAPERKLALEGAFAGAVAELQPPQEIDGTVPAWRFMDRAAMSELLEIQRQCALQIGGEEAAAGPWRGKLVGLIAAIAGLALFPFVMPWLGFMITAFAYVASLMLLLWPRLSPARAAVSIMAAGALSVGTFVLFTEVFAILLPGPAFLEGVVW